MSSLLTIPLTSFVSPSYLVFPGQSPSDTAASQGLPITNRDALVLAFEGSAVPTGFYEQTLDPDGLTGWFLVSALSADLGAQTTNLQVINGCVILPVLGIRWRYRVTALTTADLTVRMHSRESAFLTSLRNILQTGTNTIGGVNLVPGSGSQNAIAGTKTLVAAASLVAKASAGNLFGFTVKAITGAAAQQLMLFNSTTVPADGTVTPEDVFDVPAAGYLKIDYQAPKRFSTGICLALSSTGPYTKTLATSGNFAHISAQVL